MIEKIKIYLNFIIFCIKTAIRLEKQSFILNRKKQRFQSFCTNVTSAFCLCVFVFYVFILFMYFLIRLKIGFDRIDVLLCQSVSLPIYPRKHSNQYLSCAPLFQSIDTVSLDSCGILR